MPSNPRIIQIYTDGGCDRNPGGTGGWAVRLQEGDMILERSGRQDNTTNNRMELTAAIQALHLAEEHLRGTARGQIQIHTDSQYLTRGMTEWIGPWQAQKWRLKDGAPVKNVDLWQRLLELDERHDPEWIWVQGHAGDPNNLRVDKMVQEAIRGKKSKPAKESLTGAPEVKLVKHDGKPAAINLSQKGAPPGRIRVEWKDVQKLIEDLLRIQREGEER